MDKNFFILGRDFETEAVALSTWSLERAGEAGEPGVKVGHEEYAELVFESFKEFFGTVFRVGDLELWLTVVLVLLFSVAGFIKDSPDRSTMLRTGLRKRTWIVKDFFWNCGKRDRNPF